MSDTLRSLAARWRQEAAVLRHRGAAVQAEALLSCAVELERALTESSLEQLSVREAAVESGFSESQLRRRFPGMARIPRGQLPKKGERQLGPELTRHG